MVAPAAGHVRWAVGATGMDAIASAHSIFAEAFSTTPLGTRELGFLISSDEPGGGNGMSLVFDPLVISLTNGFKTYGGASFQSASSDQALGPNGVFNPQRFMATMDGTNHTFFSKGIVDTVAANTFLPAANANRRTRLYARYDTGDNDSYPCAYSLIVVSKRPWTMAEYQYLYRNPWELFAPARKIFIGATSADVTVALTGSALTGSLGTLTPNTAVALTGSLLTGSQGTASPNISVSGTGIQLTGSLGTLSPSTSVPLSGSLLTFSTGTVTANTGGDVSVAISGTDLAISTGTLIPSTSVSIAGTALASASGTVTPASSVSLSGGLLTMSTGTVTFVGDVTVAIAGEGMTISQGTVSVTGGDATGGGSNPGGGGGGNSAGWSSKFEFAPKTVKKKRKKDSAQELATESPPVVKNKAESNKSLAKALVVDLLSNLDDDDEAIAAVIEYETQLIASVLSKVQ